MVFLAVFDVLFFFFKQKTAYEMRISDWSSDVCSSDLAAAQSIDFELGFQERRALGSSTGPEYGSLSSFSPAKAVSEGVSAMLSCTNILARNRVRLSGEKARPGASSILYRVTLAPPPHTTL